MQSNNCVSSSDLWYSEQMSQPESKKELEKRKKWAIVALIRLNDKDIAPRNFQLAYTLKPYARNHKITVIFFSELAANISTKQIEQWQKVFIGVAKVKVIDTSRNGYNLAKRYGYSYMCKFFALDMYEYLKEYDYYMRCDTDCFINMFDYDLLKWVQQNQIEYGYAIRKLEAHTNTTTTLPIWTRNYYKGCGLKPTAKMDNPMSVCFNFYNNWHVGKVSFFLRPDVQHFLQSVNSSGNILKYRWGDSSIQAYAVRLFMKPKHISVVPDFFYIHGSHNLRVSTFDKGGDSNVPQTLPYWDYRQDEIKLLQLKKKKKVKSHLFPIK